jgi:hypothetical protein
MATPGALLESVTFSPPGGAGVANESGRVTDAPGATLRLGPSPISDAAPQNGNAEMARIAQMLRIRVKGMDADLAAAGNVGRNMIENTVRSGFSQFSQEHSRTD